MTYEITTANAARLIERVFNCVRDGEDSKGDRIDTWGIRHTNTGEKRLVHNTNQWEKKGCLNLKVVPHSNNRRVKAGFRYWSRFPREERNGNEADYYLGRFTELILVHFKDDCQKIRII